MIITGLLSDNAAFILQEGFIIAGLAVLIHELLSWAETRSAMPDRPLIIPAGHIAASSQAGGHLTWTLARSSSATSDGKSFCILAPKPLPGRADCRIWKYVDYLS